jgi:hypothetical protein
MVANYYVCFFLPENIYYVLMDVARPSSGLEKRSNTSVYLFASSSMYLFPDIINPSNFHQLKRYPDTKSSVPTVHLLSYRNIVTPASLGVSLKNRSPEVNVHYFGKNE